MLYYYFLVLYTTIMRKMHVNVFAVCASRKKPFKNRRPVHHGELCQVRHFHWVYQKLIVGSILLSFPSTQLQSLFAYHFQRGDSAYYLGYMVWNLIEDCAFIYLLLGKNEEFSNVDIENRDIHFPATVDITSLLNLQ